MSFNNATTQTQIDSKADEFLVKLKWCRSDILTLSEDLYYFLQGNVSTIHNGKSSQASVISARLIAAEAELSKLESRNYWLNNGIGGLLKFASTGSFIVAGVSFLVDDISNTVIFGGVGVGLGALAWWHKRTYIANKEQIAAARMLIKQWRAVL